MTTRQVNDLQMFDEPRQGQFTQGTIFSCAYAENYGGAHVHGLVITARCDAAQKKVPIYSYIPVVSIKDWIFGDGAEIVLRRREAELEAVKINTLNQLNVSPSLLRTQTSEDIVESVLKPKAEADRGISKKVSSFVEADALVRQIQEAIETISKEKRKCALQASVKLTEAVVKELAANKLLGYYLLRGMPSLNIESKEDYVALLREVHHVPSSLAANITDGIDKEYWVPDAHQEVRCPVFSDLADMCAPVARLRSPWMEHLMQSWTLLFARIGVEDIDAKSVRGSLVNLEIGLKEEA